MAYGLEIRNANGDLVIDSTNEVVLVSEKNTISGQRTSAPSSVYADYGHKWYSIDGNRSYRCCVHLTNNYDNPPIVAIRGESGGYNILLPTVRVFSSDGTYVDRLFFRTDFPRSIDYIVCAGASECPSSSRAVGSDTYGLTLKNSSDDTIFDSRWAAIVSCTSLETFPSGVDVDISIGSPPGPFTTIISKTNQSVTIPSTPAAFFAVSSLRGQKAFYEDTTSGAGGEPVEEYGGGVFGPSLIQTGDTTITATCIKTSPGINGQGNQYATAGTQYTDDAFTGNFQVLRYLDF